MTVSEKEQVVKELAVIVQNFQKANEACSKVKARGGALCMKHAQENITALRDWRERLLKFDVSALLE